MSAGGTTAPGGMDKPGLIYAAVAAMVADLSKVGLAKDATNKFDGYAYRSVDSLRRALGHLQGVHGVVILPTMLACDTNVVEIKDGKTLLHTTVRMTYRFVAAADGSELTIEVFGEGADRGDKSIGKAASAAYKIAMLQVFAVGDGTDADDDSPELVKRSAPHRGTRRAQPHEAVSAAPAFVDESEAAEIEANLRDAIESADSLTAIEALGHQLTALPEAVKSHLRRPWQRRRDELQSEELQRDRGVPDRPGGEA